MKKSFLMPVFFGVALLSSVSGVQAAGQNKSNINWFERVFLAGAFYVGSSVLDSYIPQGSDIAKTLCNQWGNFLVVDTLLSERPVVTDLKNPHTIGRVAVATGIGVGTCYAAQYSDNFKKPINVVGTLLAFNTMKSEHAILHNLTESDTLGRLAISGAILTGYSYLGDKVPGNSKGVIKLMSGGLVFNTMFNSKPTVYKVWGVGSEKQSVSD